MKSLDHIRRLLGSPLVHIEDKRPDCVTPIKQAEHYMRRRRFCKNGRPWCVGRRSQEVLWLDDLPAGVIATPVGFAGNAGDHRHEAHFRALGRIKDVNPIKEV